MFTIDIKKEVQDLVDQVSQQTGATLDENVIMLMEWSMKMGIIKAGIALTSFSDKPITNKD